MVETNKIILYDHTKYMKKFILISMVLLCLIIIFLLSNENAIKSTETSIKITSIINFNNINLVRKLAHFTEYLVLEFLLLLLISCYKKIDFRYYIISLLLCLLYATSDELHQLFILGRNGNIMDILIDFSGSIVSSMIYISFSFIYKEVFIK